MEDIWVMEFRADWNRVQEKEAGYVRKGWGLWDPGKAQLSCFPEGVWQNRKYICVLRIWVSVPRPTQCTYINSPWEAETSYNIQVTTTYIFYLIHSNSYEPVLTCLKNSKMFSAVYKNNEIPRLSRRLEPFYLTFSIPPEHGVLRPPPSSRQWLSKQ